MKWLKQWRTRRAALKEQAALLPTLQWWDELEESKAHPSWTPPDEEHLRAGGEFLASAPWLTESEPCKDCPPPTQRDWIGEPCDDPTPDPIRYPEPEGDRTAACQWVSDQLRIVTAPPFDITALGDQARIAEAIEYGGLYYARGYSLPFMTELLERAMRMDPTLTIDDLFILRSRGLL